MGKKKAKKRVKVVPWAGSKASQAGPKCGLCGKTKKLVRTECCGNWICDDEHTYVMFSFATNSCMRNHRRYTLCGYHFNEQHEGDWKECAKCRKSFEAEMVAWYGTNEFNFEKLPNPPAFEPKHCTACGKVISLGTDGYMTSGDEYYCERCSAKRMREGR